MRQLLAGMSPRLGVGQVPRALLRGAPLEGLNKKGGVCRLDKSIGCFPVGQ
jgi:hypothetical protein